MAKNLFKEAANLKDEIIDDLQSAQEKCEDFIEDGGDAVKEYACQAKKFVIKNLKKHPVRTLGFATLIGFIISHLFRKK